MLSILKSPYPCIYGQKENFFVALSIGLFVAIFLLVFQPFSIAESGDILKTLKTAGFGLVSFVVMLFYYFIPPRIFVSFFKERNYTFGKDLLLSAGLILLIGLANGVYAQFVLHVNALVSIWLMIWQTFLVGIFPLAFLSLFQYNRLLNANLKASKEIVLPAPHEPTESNEKPILQYFSISGDQEEKQIELNDFLYLESDGNYAFLHQKNNGPVSKTMYRTTLKSIELENTFPNVFRCHRSYIINLDQVKEVKGNAQGLKLSLKDSEDIVPVSKKYIPAFKKYFYQD